MRRTRYIGIAVGVCVLMIVCMLSTRGHSSRSAAQSILNLPPDAEVLEVTPADYDDGGLVVFRFPTGPSADHRFEEVWTLNKARIPKAAITKDSLSDGSRLRLATTGGFWWELKYIKKSDKFVMTVFSKLD